MAGFRGRGLGRPAGFGAVFLLILLPLVGGCPAKEAPLSPAAAAFKAEVKDCLTRFSAPLAEPLVKADIPAINTALSKIEPANIKLCRMCPFRIAVLSRVGETVAVYPKIKGTLDFSNYDAVKEVLKNKKIVAQRLFQQDGSQLYIVCDPLSHQGAVVGILVLSLDAAEAQQRWGITEAEFQALDFNR